jgi:hypothetical protein
MPLIAGIAPVGSDEKQPATHTLEKSSFLIVVFVGCVGIRRLQRAGTALAPLVISLVSINFAIRALRYRMLKSAQVQAPQNQVISAQR